MAKSNPYYVLIDTNIWVSERLLQTSIGHAFLYAITESNSSIILPEVIELEISRVLPEMAEQSVKIIKREITLLRQLSGHNLTVTAPSALAIEEGISERWKQLGGAIVNAPFTHEQAKSALQRVIRKMPPSGDNNEQFRDCCIWDTAISMATDRTVHLVSQDNAFYENRNRSAGLSNILRSELKNEKRKVKIHSSLRDFLSEVTSDVTAINEEEIGHQITSAIAERAREIASEGVTTNPNETFKLGGVRRLKINGYATPKPSLIAISFEISFDLERNIIRDETEERINSTMTLKGVGSYNPIEKKLLEIDIREWSKRLKSASGGFMAMTSPDKQTNDCQYAPGKMRVISGDGSTIFDM
jgi:hypothetical protein